MDLPWSSRHTLPENLPLVSNLDWDVRGVGNFDRNQPNARPDDLLWYNRRTGERVLWFMDGTEKRSSVALLPEREAPGDLLGIGDFDGNGTPDLLWQQDDGTRSTPEPGSWPWRPC